MSHAPAGVAIAQMFVQKFGGTSVADPEAIRRLIDIVRQAQRGGKRGPVAVVSAMSGVTDGLLGAAADAGARRPDEALARLATLRELTAMAATVRETLNALRRSAEAARDMQEELHARYRAGLGTSLELADAETRRVQSEIEVSLAEFEVHRVKARIQRFLEQ